MNFLTNDFGLLDALDQSKILDFNISALTTGTLNTLVIPALGGIGTVAITGLGQTFTNIPNFEGGLTVDTLADHNTFLEVSNTALRFQSGVPSGQTIKWSDSVTAKAGTIIVPASITADRSWIFRDADFYIAGHLALPTAGRVPFIHSTGTLTDDADLTFATDTLTATKIVGTTSIKAGTAAGYISSDGSTGATGSFTTTDGKTVTVKDGIITSIV